MNERRTEEQKRQYEKMVDSIREGAGRVFDAMLTKGESVFSSLARFAESVLQTMLRNVFQNSVQALALGTGRADSSEAAEGAAWWWGAQLEVPNRGLVRSFGGLRGCDGVLRFCGMLGGPCFGIGGGEGAGDGRRSGILGWNMRGGAAGAVASVGGPAAGAATAGIGFTPLSWSSYLSGLFKAARTAGRRKLARRAGVIQGSSSQPEIRRGSGLRRRWLCGRDQSDRRYQRNRRVPTVVVNVNNNMIDARHAEKLVR